MNWLNTLVAIFAGGLAWTTRAEPLLLPDHEPQRVFSGEGRLVNSLWQNVGGNIFQANIRTRILQASSATTIPFSENNWQRIKLLPGQTVLESTPLNFPNVRAGTKFIVQWVENSNQVLGRTEVMVYPTNLLAELKELAAGTPIGVLDPQSQLKPWLKYLSVDFIDLQNADVRDFSGKLAVLGPFASEAQMRTGLVEQVQALANKGTAIVWYRPPADKTHEIMPSFFVVPAITNSVVIAQPELAKNLASDPEAQLHLLSLCRTALRPSVFFASSFSLQP